jgi:hypothetical protein
MSTSSVRFSAAATLAARFTAVVVLPTPPFWFTTARTRVAGEAEVAVAEADAFVAGDAGDAAEDVADRGMVGGGRAVFACLAARS